MKKYILVLSLILIGILIYFPVKNYINPMAAKTGIAYFGIQSKTWPCEDSIQALKNVKELHLAFVYNTFGTGTKCLDRFIGDSRLKSLEIHLNNGPGLRNYRLGSYELLAGETVGSVNSKLERGDKQFLNKFKKQSKAVHSTIISKLAPGTRCLINPVLENNLTVKAGEMLYAFMKPLYPNCDFVWNGLSHTGGIRQADLVESHGEDSIATKGGLTNLDGTDIHLNIRPPLDSNHLDENMINTYLRNRTKAYVNYLWIREFNGLYTSNWIDPRQRKGWPTKAVFNQVAKYINN